LRSASRADRRLAAGLTLAVLAAAPIGTVAQPRAGGTSAPPALLACAGGAASPVVHSVRRLMSLNDKAAVESDVARVFAQREKEQRVSSANLAKARLSIDFLYAAGEGAARMYYYEASKTIPDAQTLLRISVSGWLRGDGVPPRSLGSKGELQWIELVPESDGDLEIIPEPAAIPDPTASLLPVGVLGHAGGHVWVMRRAIGNGTLLVYDVGPRGVRLRPASAKCRAV
jgi:hypothetical protein